jgi:hypothetical protein
MHELKTERKDRKARAAIAARLSVGRAMATCDRWKAEKKQAWKDAERDADEIGRRVKIFRPRI